MAKNAVPAPPPAAAASTETAELIRRRELWPIDEACYRLGISRSTLYRRATAGEIRIARVGARAFVSDAELRRFVANLEAASA